MTLFQAYVSAGTKNMYLSVHDKTFHFLQTVLPSQQLFSCNVKLFKYYMSMTFKPLCSLAANRQLDKQTDGHFMIYEINKFSGSLGTKYTTSNCYLHKETYPCLVCKQKQQTNRRTHRGMHTNKNEHQAHRKYTKALTRLINKQSS